MSSAPSSMKFIPTHWRGDQALRAVTLPARGLWIEMMCIMHEATPYGYLKLGRKNIDAPKLAQMVNTPVELVVQLLEELQEADVFSVDNGAIFSRRMVRDARRRASGEKNAKKRWSQPAENTAKKPVTNGHAAKNRHAKSMPIAAEKPLENNEAGSAAQPAADPTLFPQESPPRDPPSKNTPISPSGSSDAQAREEFSLEAEEPKAKKGTIIGQARQLDAFRHELTPVVGPALVDDIVATRRSKRGALTGNAGRLLARNLRNCGDPVAAAEEMVVRGWLSIKPEWITSSSHGARSPPAASGSPPASDAEDYSEEAMLRYAANYEAKQNARRK